MISNGRVTDTQVITLSCITVIIEIQLTKINFEIFF